MTLEDLVQTIKQSGQHSYVYHFTDPRNFPLIETHGLLSKNAMRQRGIWPSAPSGNQWSWDADDRLGISKYVSLCMTLKHPMCHTAKEEGRIINPNYLRILPDVLLTNGVLFAADIANKTGVQLVPLRDALDEIDVEVLYQRTKWSDPEVSKRLRAVERYEILVPNGIELRMIKKIWN